MALVLTMTVAVLAATCVPMQRRSAASTADTSFYTPPAPLPAGRDGDVIRRESMNVSVDIAGVLAAAQRVMYLSRDARNRPIAVTGTVLTPTRPWLGSGARPLIGYAVGTQGMGDACAPSRQLADGGPEYELPNVLQLLLRGYGVALTDYQGLGTPGEHTYLNPTAEAHAVLDSIRAAQRLPQAGLPAAGPVGIMGYSQGGGAAAAAAEVQPSYAPELALKGVYAGGVPADPVALLKKIDGSLAAGLGSYFLTGLHAAYPWLPVDQMLNEKGRRLAAQTANECWDDTVVKHALLRYQTLTSDGRTLTAHLSQPPFRSVMAGMVLGRRAPAAPVLVLQAPLDELVPYRNAVLMARSWCASGVRVQFEPLLVPEHVAASYEGFLRASAWMATRFTGRTAVSNCGAF